MAFCQNCGAELSEGAKFCASCGSPTESITTTTVAQPVTRNYSLPKEVIIRGTERCPLVEFVLDSDGKVVRLPDAPGLGVALKPELAAQFK